MTGHPIVLWFVEPMPVEATLRSVVELDAVGVHAVVLPGLPDTPVDPVLLAAAASRRTQHIGVVAGLSPWTQPPFLTARALGTLDALTRGRAGWFVDPRATGVRSSDDSGRWAAPGAHGAERTAALADHLTATFALWESWEPDAMVADVTTGRYVDASKVTVTNHRGPHYSSRGPLNAPPGPQGRPVVIADHIDGGPASAVADVLVVTQESQVGHARRTSACVLLALDPTTVQHPPRTRADGYAVRGVAHGAVYGAVLHRVLPSLLGERRRGLLREQMALDPSRFVPSTPAPGTAVPAPEDHR